MSKITTSFIVFLCCLANASLHAEDAPSKSNSEKHQALTQLFADEWERGLRESPESATNNGDKRFNDRWTDLSLGAIQQSAIEDRAALERLHAIGRQGLSADDELNYDTFEWEAKQAVDRQSFKEYLLPVNQKNGPQLDDGIAETTDFSTVKDYRDYLSRLAGMPKLIDQTVTLMKLGVKDGYTPPRILLERVPAQIGLQIVDDPAQSPFYRPFLKFSDNIADADRIALSKEAQTVIRDKLVPAFRGFLAYVKNDYIPHCRTSIAASDLPDGKAYYNFLVRDQTTTNLSADQIHETGLLEVKRIHAKMEKLKDEIGFKGELQSFFTYLRTDPQFFYKTPQELFTAYSALAKRIDPELVRVFKIIPRLPYGVRPIPDNAAPDTTTAYYMPGASDGTRPGFYYVNLYKPESRPKWEMMPLTLHESVPGHHFQFARALELPEAPMFRKTAYFVAYSEGWALYAEQLGYDMGLYNDRYDQFGQLTYEMWRAVRLVVDTGMHSRGWSREKAIAYFKENTAKTELDIVNEIDRYIGDPGQALAYKVGQMKISALRNKAHDALGSNFDLRDFNDAVLAVGSVPLTALEAHIDAWIIEKKGH
jgi:uncharacterized protein (DUF885 family)